MIKFSEQTLSNWTYPVSDTEESKLLNAEKLVKDAIRSSSKLKSASLQIFGQGSYANDTNVRLNSDIDINIMYTGAFHYDLPTGEKKEDYGLNNPASYSFDSFKNDVEVALVEYFGRNFVKRGNKCITVLANSTRVETDVVPTWSYRRYNLDKSYTQGVYFKPDEGTSIRSYPKQHIDNGKLKNGRTQKRFKRLTRVLKKIRYKMIEDNVYFSENISSFLIECLLWNVPDRIFNDYDTWTMRLKESIRYLYQQTVEDEKCKEWGEVSELLYLIRSSRKWSRKDINQFTIAVWQYMNFQN